MRKNIDQLLFEFLEKNKKATGKELKDFIKKHGYAVSYFYQALSRLRETHGLKRITYYTIGE